MSKEPIYEVEVRPNGRGGYEIAEFGAPVGMGLGNYPLDQAIHNATSQFEESRVKIIEEFPEAAPVAQKPKLKLRQVKKEVCDAS